MKMLAAIVLATASGALAGDEIIWRSCDASTNTIMTNVASTYETGETSFVNMRGDATGAIVAAGTGQIDFGWTTRPSLPGESGLDLQFTVVGWDALVPVTHSSNSIRSLTIDELQGIFSGEITNWREVGGANAPIEVFVTESRSSGLGAMTRTMLFNDEDANFGENANAVASDLEASIETNPNAIAMTTYSIARHCGSQMVAIQGVQPTSRTIASGEYAFYMPLYLAHREDLTPGCETFLSWLTGPEGQRAIGTSGVITLRQGASLVSLYDHWSNRELVANYSTLMRQADGFAAVEVIEE